MNKVELAINEETCFSHLQSQERRRCYRETSQLLGNHRMSGAKYILDC